MTNFPIRRTALWRVIADQTVRYGPDQTYEPAYDEAPFDTNFRQWDGIQKESCGTLHQARWFPHLSYWITPNIFEDGQHVAGL